MVECTLLGASIFPFDLKKGLFNNPRCLKDLNAKVQYASTKDMKKKYFCLTISTFPFGGSSHMYFFFFSFIATCSCCLYLSMPFLLWSIFPETSRIINIDSKCAVPLAWSSQLCYLTALDWFDSQCTMQQVRINSRGLAYIDPYTLVGEKKGDVYTFHIEVHIQFKKRKTTMTKTSPCNFKFCGAVTRASIWLKSDIISCFLVQTLLQFPKSNKHCHITESYKLSQFVHL